MTKCQCLTLIFLLICMCRKTHQSEIDVFINQLLSSQRFEELADIVAEKAAKKIRSIGASDDIFLRSSLMKQRGEVGDMEKENNNKSNEREDQISQVINNKSYETVQPIEYKKNQLNRIDVLSYQGGETRSRKVSTTVTMKTAALFNKDDESGQAELSQKQNYQKKPAQNEKPDNSQDFDSYERNPWQHLEYFKAQQQNGTDVQNPASVVSAEQHVKYADRNKMTKKKEDETNNETIPKKQQLNSENTPGLAVIDIDENGAQKAIEEINDDPFQRPEAIAEDVVEQGDSPRKSRYSIVWRAQSSESHNHDSEEPERNDQYSEASTPGYKLRKLTTARRVIRKEGNRYYTYLSGPEYAEFHEQLAKEEKSKDGVFR